jgi:hypothetical protein
LSKIRAFSNRLAGAFPFSNESLKLFAFLSAQPHNISLHRCCLPSHRPLVARIATKGNHRILSNWLKRRLGPQLGQHCCFLAGAGSYLNRKGTGSESYENIIF